MLFFNHCVTQLEENKFQMLKIKKVISAKARVKKLVETKCIIYLYLVFNSIGI
jgi:hypothetical protein